MNALSLIRFLDANHSVRLISDRGRRLVLPSGPVFPKFGRSAPRSDASLPLTPAVASDPDRGAILLRRSDENGPGAEDAKDNWLQATARFFHGARRS
jgi:hypothetical protein